MIDIEKNYQIAETIIGKELAKDLVHHCFLLVKDFSKIKYPDTYFYRIMIRESYSKGSFSKKYLNKLPKIKIEQDSKFDNFDPIRVRVILNDIISEGYKEEVLLFEDYVSGKSVLKLSRLLKVDPRQLTAIIKFVKFTIKERYGECSDKPIHCNSFEI